MNSALLRHSTQDFSLEQLVDSINRGELALPDFQRAFVWDPSQVVELLDSVARGWPIGSLLLLEGPQPFGIQSIKSGPDTHRERVKLYLLDGQQRITSLFHALTDTSDFVYFIDLDELEASDGPQIKWIRRSRYASAKGALIKISELTSPTSDAFFDLNSSARLRLNDLIRSRFPGLMLNSYTIPGIVMSSEIELEALTRIFETLNRTGERLDAFDLMVAVLRPSGFLLREQWEIAALDYPILWQMRVDPVEILKLIALWQRDIDRETGDRPASRRVSGVRQRDVLNTPPVTVLANWPRAISSYAAALRFLANVGGVHDNESMPSWAMVLTTAYLLDRKIPNERLEKWYWRSIVTQRYAQGANTQVTSDVDARAESFDSFPLKETLTIALSEPARRNRILRFGIRGLYRRINARDVITGRELHSPIVEISTVRASSGDFRWTLDDPLFELAFCSRESLTQKTVSEEAIWSQGIVSAKLLSPEGRLLHRVAAISKHIEEWV